MEPLFIFMDLEAAHGDVLFGDIIELAAQVDPRILDNETFSSVINTKQNLAYFATEVSKITRSMLDGKEYFPEVFKDFLAWIDKVVDKCSKRNERKYYPVLVAHGGFDMDFMMTRRNLERNKMDVDVLGEHNLHFADTLYFLGTKRLNGELKCLEGSNLSIKALLQTLYPEEEILGQHRALADVKFMIKIFIECTEVKEHFNEITIATYKSRNEAFRRYLTLKRDKKFLNDNNLPQDPVRE